MAKLKATFHVKKDIGYDELEITTSADGVTYGGGTSGLSATDVQSAIDEVVTETTVALNTKQATITGGATTIATSNLTVNKALISDASGKVGTSATSNTELGYLSGVTSAVQTQLNAIPKEIINTQSLNFPEIANGSSYTINFTNVNIDTNLGNIISTPYEFTGASTYLVTVANGVKIEIWTANASVHNFNCRFTNNSGILSHPTVYIKYYS